MTVAVVGRDSELAELERFLEELRTGPGSLVVEGDAGIGKTTVWRAAVERAEQRGYCVLTSCPAESESQLAYAGLADLLARVDEAHFADLPSPQRHALDAALLRAISNEAAPQPRAVFAGFGAVLRALSREGPVLIAVDDRQWLDRGTRQALDYATRRLSVEPVGLLVSARRDGWSPWAAGAGLLRLGPLSPAALHRLIKTRTGVSLPRPSVLRVHRMTEGNPFFALQVVEGLASAGFPDATAAWPVPDALQESVAARLQSLTSAVRQALCSAAATARPTIAGLDEPELRVAERAGIVTIADDGRVRFAHPLLASAIYSSATAAERRRVHAVLAGQVEDVEERARHLALAAEEPDERVAALLDKAAVAARTRGAPDLAAELARRASALTPPDQALRSWQRQLTSTEHSLHAGDLVSAQSALLDLVGAAPPGSALSSALRMLGEVCYRLGRLDDALRFLRQSVNAAVGDPMSVAKAEISWAFVMFYSFGSFAQAAAAARHALTLVETFPGQSGLLSSALAMHSVGELALGRGLDDAAIARALALEDHELYTPVEWRASLIVGSGLLETEQLDRGRAVLDGLRARLVDRGEDSDLPEVLAPLARLECSAGNLDTADELATYGFELAVQEGSDSRASLASGVSALISANQGKERETRAAAEQAIRLAAASGWQVGAFWAATALGLLELSLGNDQAVVSTLARSLRLVEEDGVVDPFRRPFLPDAIEALVRLGDTERAENLTQQLQDCARQQGRRTALVSAARCRALVTAAAGESHAALDELDRVLEESPEIPMPLPYARTLLVRGQLLRRTKQKREAAECLGNALEVFEQIGADLWVTRTRVELSRLGRVAEPGALTETEGQIARLAATGLTNREVAAAAFCSVKTVEANMSRIYHKLGIHSRAELGAWLTARDHLSDWPDTSRGSHSH